MGAVSITNWGGHSARVSMRLLVNGRSIRVVQMGRDFLLIEEPLDQPPAGASLVLQVDNSERRWDVLLPQGISSTSKRVAIAPGA